VGVCVCGCVCACVCVCVRVCVCVGVTGEMKIAAMKISVVINGAHAFFFWSS